MPLANASADELRLAGLNALVQGNYQQAIVYYSRAIEIEPGRANDNFRRGIAYMNVEENDKAIMDFTEAIEIEPNNVEAYNLRGSVYINKKMYFQAIDDFNESIKLEPKDANLYNSRGVAYMASNNFDKAVADFKKVLEISNDEELRAKVKRQLRDLGIDVEKLSTPTVTPDTLS